MMHRRRFLALMVGVVVGALGMRTARAGDGVECVVIDGEVICLGPAPRWERRPRRRVRRERRR